MFFRTGEVYIPINQQGIEDLSLGDSEENIICKVLPEDETKLLIWEGLGLHIDECCGIYISESESVIFDMESCKKVLKYLYNSEYKNKVPVLINSFELAVKYNTLLNLYC